MIVFARLVQLFIGCGVIGAMAVTLSMSFAALVYAGPLSSYLGQGIALALAGAAVMALVGTFTSSLRGAICNPQDITAVLLGAAALGFATSGAVGADSLFPTVVALLFAACLFAGVTLFLAGTLRLGSLVRYVPYPVIAGFLAATGYLLIMGGLGIVARESVGIFNLADVVAGLPVVQWLPWIVGAFALAVAARRIPGDFVVPAALCFAAAVFFAILNFAGMSPGQALDGGLLLGPFEEVDPGLVFATGFVEKVAWAEIFRAAPTLVAVAGLTLLGALLNTTGLAITLGQAADTEREMRATGLANVAAGFVGGLPGYVILGESILARRLGLWGYLPGLTAALACGAAVIIGVEFLAYVPAGLMAMVVAYLGFDLLATWLWDSRRRLSRFEYGVVLLIVLIAATLGFLQALAIGTLAAAAIFIISYAKTDVLRSRATGATRRSRVERPDEEMEILSRAGRSCVVLELSGFLFFGTADRVARLAKKEIGATEDLRFLVLDFRRVTGLDASAAVSLVDVLSAARAAKVEVTFCAMSDEVKRQFLLADPPEGLVRFDATADAALEGIEDRLLDEAQGDAAGRVPRLMEIVTRLEREFAGRPEAIRRLTLEPGEELLARGAASSEFYVLVAGALRAEIDVGDTARLRVAEFRPCAMIGEIAYYAGVPRTACVVADRPSEVVRIDLGHMEEAPSATLLEFHKAAARSLARRVMRMTELTRTMDG